MKKKTVKAVCAVLGLALTIGLTGCGAAQAGAAPANEPVPQVTVSASGSVRLVPDKVTVYFGVMTQKETAEEAQNRNSEDVSRVIEVLTGRGIEEKSIKTTNYSMYPQYHWSETGEQSITGYSVTTTMSVQDQDIGNLGALLSACVAAGINQVDNISFLCSGYDEAYHQALGKAVEAARAKAEVLAAAGGKQLGDVLTITEGWQDTSARYGKSAAEDAAYAMEASRDTAEPVLQPGETEIRANVTVTYRMQ